MLTFTGPEDLKARVGEELGVSGWVEITQPMVDAFAQLTGDHQFIHVDPDRAAQTPFAGTIAHGLLTLALGPRLSYELYELRGYTYAVNYGYDRIRYPAPLPTGSRVRMRAVLASVQDVPGGVQITVVQTFERDGADKPVCVAESLVRAFA